MAIAGLIFFREPVRSRGSCCGAEGSVLAKGPDRKAIFGVEEIPRHASMGKICQQFPGRPCADKWVDIRLPDEMKGRKLRL